MVAGGAGTCVLTETAKPQLVTCTLDDSIAPGASSPEITLLVTVDAGVNAGSDLVNQARVRGQYESVIDLPQP